MKITATFETAKQPGLDGVYPSIVRLSERNEQVEKLLELCGYMRNGVADCWVTKDPDAPEYVARALFDTGAVNIEGVTVSTVGFNWQVHLMQLAASKAQREAQEAQANLALLARQIRMGEATDAIPNPPPVFSTENPFAEDIR